MADSAFAAGGQADDSSAVGLKRRLWTRVGVRHVVMVVAGVVALTANLALLRSADPKTEVVVAAADLAAGEVVTAGMLRTEPIAGTGTAVARFLAAGDLEEVLGRVVRRDVARGNALVTADLRPRTAAGVLRAMSLDIDPLRAVGGALSPGDVVDVVAVQDGAAAYVATGLDVLAVVDESGRLGSGSWAVTVAVDDGTALRLAAALSSGDVHVVRATGTQPATAVSWPPGEPSAGSDS